MYGFVSGHNVAAVEHRLAAVEVGGEAARLADEEQAGGHVPGRKAALPEAVEAAGRHPGEVERGRAEAADARHLPACTAASSFR